MQILNYEYDMYDSIIRNAGCDQNKISHACKRQSKLIEEMRREQTKEEWNYGKQD
jgi:hypothetical protein